MILMDQVGEKQPDAGFPAPAVFLEVIGKFIDWFASNHDRGKNLGLMLSAL